MVVPEGVPPASAQSIHSWLGGLQLERYADAVAAQGYDKVQFLSDADESDIDELIAAVEMMKPHAKTLKKAWAALVRGAGR